MMKKAFTIADNLYLVLTYCLIHITINRLSINRNVTIIIYGRICFLFKKCCS